MSYGSLKAIDLSKNTELVYLNCEKNSLTELNLSQNNKLDTLICSSNKIAELILPTKASNLTFIQCYANNLKTIDVTRCPNLKILTIFKNPNFDGKLDVTKNTKLEGLACHNVLELDLSNCLLLNDFAVINGKFPKLDLSKHSCKTSA